MRSQLFSYTFVPPGSFHRHTGLDRLYKEKVQVEIMIPVSTIQYGKNRFLRLYINLVLKEALQLWIRDGNYHDAAPVAQESVRELLGSRTNQEEAKRPTE